MKKIILLLLLFPSLAFAQQPPFGYHATWHFYYDEYGIIGYDSVYHHSDSTFLGKDWLVLKRQKDNKRILTRTSNDSIFYIGHKGNELLFYIREAQVGFEWQFSEFDTIFNCSDTPTVSVINVGFDNFSGVQLRYQELENIMDTILIGSPGNPQRSGTYILHNKIYDRLGNWPGFFNYILPVFNFCGFNKTQLTGPSYSLTCYRDDDVSIVFRQQGCVGGLGISEIEKLHYSLFPNPSNGTLYIETESDLDEIIIYSIHGQKLATYTGTNSIELPTFAGIYTVQLVFSNGERRFERVIRQ